MLLWPRGPPCFLQIRQAHLWALEGPFPKYLQGSHPHLLQMPSIRMSIYQRLFLTTPSLHSLASPLFYFFWHLTLTDILYLLSVFLHELKCKLHEGREFDFFVVLCHNLST